MLCETMMTWWEIYFFLIESLWNSFLNITTVLCTEMCCDVSTCWESCAVQWLLRENVGSKAVGLYHQLSFGLWMYSWETIILHTTVCLHWLGDSSGSLNTINLTSVTLRHSAYSARGHFGPGSDVPQFSFDENLRLRRQRCDPTYFTSKDPMRMFYTLKSQSDQWQRPDLYLICLLRLKRLLRNYSYFLAGTFLELSLTVLQDVSKRIIQFQKVIFFKVMDRKIKIHGWI